MPSIFLLNHTILKYYFFKCNFNERNSPRLFVESHFEFFKENIIFCIFESFPTKQNNPIERL